MVKTRARTFIQAWRKHRGLTQEQLAERIDKTAGMVSLLERGLATYTQDTLESIATALDCDVLDLLARDPTQAESLWQIWRDATPAQRRQLEAVALAMFKLPKS